ncbi:hypothetical protein L2E82_35872 [Cichorium intybus]|uniref:Uncharacterized protein n=1 Tax=Cichorium intybus TaxID=13427 RepID=A0ACB9BQ06_CICIN|nr:hypothetical protein L2E82_35872 [Cichorium intybus]
MLSALSSPHDPTIDGFISSEIPPSPIALHPMKRLINGSFFTGCQPSTPSPRSLIPSTPIGLIAAKECASPFEFYDIVTFTTHKSLRGPRGGIIFYKKGLKTRKKTNLLNQGDGSYKYDFKEKIKFDVCPALQGGPHNKHIAAL